MQEVHLENERAGTQVSYCLPDGGFIGRAIDSILSGDVPTIRAVEIPINCLIGAGNFSAGRGESCSTVLKWSSAYIEAPWTVEGAGESGRSAWRHRRVTWGDCQDEGDGSCEQRSQQDSVSIHEGAAF